MNKLYEEVGDLNPTLQNPERRDCWCDMTPWLRIFARIATKICKSRPLNFLLKQFLSTLRKLFPLTCCHEEIGFSYRWSRSSFSVEYLFYKRDASARIVSLSGNPRVFWMNSGWSHIFISSFLAKIVGCMMYLGSSMRI
jgi:hypothetical protein